MGESGGPSTQRGVIYQNKVAALYLGRLIDPRPDRKSENLIEVRVEAPSPVDDIVLRFEDGHCEWIQVKESINRNSKAWKKLWKDFEDQRWSADFGDADIIILVFGKVRQWSGDLRELWSRATGSKNGNEWVDRLSLSQRNLLKKICALLTEHHQNNESLFTLFSNVKTRFIDSAYLETDYIFKFMPESNLTTSVLFDKLLKIVGDHAVIRKVINRDILLNQLRNESIDIYERGDGLRILSRDDKTLGNIREIISRDLEQTGQRMEENIVLLSKELSNLSAKIQKVQEHFSIAQAHHILGRNLSIDDINYRAFAFQNDALRWLSARDPDIASMRLAEARTLLDEGLKREPKNSYLLVQRGYVEKTQAQISIMKDGLNTAHTLFRNAYNYFLKALNIDENNYGAYNGLANIYFYLKDYETAIKIGKMLFEVAPDYGPAMHDFSLALEMKLRASGLDAEQHQVLLTKVYEHLLKIMPRQPQIFSANDIERVQSRISKLRARSSS